MNNVRLVQIEPTTRCNFTCAFCSGRHMKQEDLDYQTFQTIVNEMPEIICMELQGEGEPFLHPRIYDMIRYAKNHGIQVSSISNGSLLTDANVEKILDSGLDSLNISIESPVPEEFFLIRGGDLRKITEGIRTLVKRKKDRKIQTPTIGFSVTVLKSTMSKLDDIFELYQELGMDGGIAIQFLNNSKEYARYYTESENLEYLTKKEQLLVRRNYFRGLKHIQVDDRIEHFFTKIEEDVKRNSGRAGYCVWLEQALYINCQGYVSSCVYIKDGKRYGLGQIERDGIKKILQRREKEREEIRNCKLTKSCAYIGCEVVRQIRENSRNMKKSGEVNGQR